MADDEGRPVALTEKRAFALFQILRLTYFGGLTNLSRLYDALLARVGEGEQHVIAGLAHSRPRKR